MVQFCDEAARQKHGQLSSLSLKLLPPMYFADNICHMLCVSPVMSTGKHQDCKKENAHIHEQIILLASRFTHIVDISSK